MAAYERHKIVRISDFFGPKTSPSDSPLELPKPPDRNPPGRARFMMERFFIRGFCRRRDRGGYWYARVTDLRTGKTFRMSSGEKNLKKANKGVRLKLRLITKPTSEEQPVAEWVKDEAYFALEKALQASLELIERGKNAITPEDLERSIRQVIPQSPEPEGPVFYVAFEEYLKTKDVRRSTLEDYHHTGRLFSRFIEAKHVHEVTGLDVQNFLESFKRDGKSQRTRQKHLNCLRSFFCWARDVAKYVKEDPAAGIKVRVQRSKRKKKRSGLRIDEARRLLKACREKRKQRKHDIQHIWLAVFIALRTGLRLRNVLGLRWSQVDLEKGTVHIPAAEYKADRDLEIPIHVELWRVLQLWKLIRKNSPLVSCPSHVLGKRVKEVKVPFDAAAKRAGIKTDFHNLRHAFETWLVEADVSGAVQTALMGQSPKSVTENYAHPSLEKMRECVNRLPRLFGNKD